MLQRQLEALAGQTVRPTQIWVCVFASKKQQELSDIVEAFKRQHPLTMQEVHLITSDFNFKYFGRFQLAMQVNTSGSCSEFASDSFGSVAGSH